MGGKTRVEVAALLGVSKSRIRDLVRDDPEFPKPLKDVETARHTMLYDEAEVLAYVKAYKARQEAAQPYMTTAEVAAKIGISRQRLYQLKDAGILTIPAGGRWTPESVAEAESAYFRFI